MRLCKVHFLEIMGKTYSARCNHSYWRIPDLIAHFRNHGNKETTFHGHKTQAQTTWTMVTGVHISRTPQEERGDRDLLEGGWRELSETTVSGFDWRLHGETQSAERTELKGLNGWILQEGSRIFMTIKGGKQMLCPCERPSCRSLSVHQGLRFSS